MQYFLCLLLTLLCLFCIGYIHFTDYKEKCQIRNYYYDRADRCNTYIITTLERCTLPYESMKSNEYVPSSSRVRNIEVDCYHHTYVTEKVMDENPKEQNIDKNIQTKIFVESFVCDDKMERLSEKKDCDSIFSGSFLENLGF